MTGKNYQSGYKMCRECRTAEDIPLRALDILAGAKALKGVKLEDMYFQNPVTLSVEDEILLREHGYLASHGPLSKECGKQFVEQYARKLVESAREAFRTRLLSSKSHIDLRDSCTEPRIQA